MASPEKNIYWKQNETPFLVRSVVLLLERILLLVGVLLLRGVVFLLLFAHCFVKLLINNMLFFFAAADNTLSVGPKLLEFVEVALRL